MYRPEKSDSVSANWRGTTRQDWYSTNHTYQEEKENVRGGKPIRHYERHGYRGVEVRKPSSSWSTTYSSQKDGSNRNQSDVYSTRGSAKVQGEEPSTGYRSRDAAPRARNFPRREDSWRNNGKLERQYRPHSSTDWIDQQYQSQRRYVNYQNERNGGIPRRQTEEIVTECRITGLTICHCCYCGGWLDDAPSTNQQRNTVYVDHSEEFYCSTDEETDYGEEDDELPEEQVTTINPAETGCKEELCPEEYAQDEISTETCLDGKPQNTECLVVTDFSNRSDLDGYAHNTECHSETTEIEEVVEKPTGEEGDEYFVQTYEHDVEKNIASVVR